MTEELMTKSRALATHLTPPQTRDKQTFFSGFWAALNDARQATNRDSNGEKVSNKPHGSWLGAVGYMALLDQIGSCFKPASHSTVQGNTIKKALSYFSSLNADEIDALYALRCAFAHDFSLVNINPDRPNLTHHFLVNEGPQGSVVDIPKERWCGDHKHRGTKNVTRVNLEKFGDLVEHICGQVFTLANEDRLEVVLDGGSDELLYRYAVYTAQETGRGQVL